MESRDRLFALLRQFRITLEASFVQEAVGALAGLMDACPPRSAYHFASTNDVDPSSAAAAISCVLQEAMTVQTIPLTDDRWASFWSPSPRWNRAWVHALHATCPYQSHCGFGLTGFMEEVEASVRESLELAMREYTWVKARPYGSDIGPTSKLVHYALTGLMAEALIGLVRNDEARVRILLPLIELCRCGAIPIGELVDEPGSWQLLVGS